MSTNKNADRKTGPKVEVRVKTRVKVDGAYLTLKPGVVDKPHADLIKAAKGPGNVLRFIPGGSDE